MKKCITNIADETGSVWNFFSDGTCRAACWNDSVWDSQWTIKDNKVIVAADALAEDKEFKGNGGYDAYKDLLRYHVTRELEIAVFDREVT